MGHVTSFLYFQHFSLFKIFLCFHLYHYLSFLSMLIRPSSAFSSKFYPSVSLRSKRARFKKESTKYWMRVGKRNSDTVKKNNWLRIGKRKNWLRIGKRMVCAISKISFLKNYNFQDDDENNGQRFLIRVGKRQLLDSIEHLKKQTKREF